MQIIVKIEANHSEEELANFRKLAKAYAELSVKQIDQLLKSKDLVEICYECEEQI